MAGQKLLLSLHGSFLTFKGDLKVRTGNDLFGESNDFSQCLIGFIVPENLNFFDEIDKVRISFKLFDFLLSLFDEGTDHLMFRGILYELFA
jgi:hypothetical protein